MSGIHCLQGAIRRSRVGRLALLLRPFWLVLLAAAPFAAPVHAQSVVGVMADGGSVRSAADGAVVGNPGEVRLVFDRLEAIFNNRIVRPARANLGFAWNADGAPACSDGINNDDHSALGRGVQDATIDYPADVDCVSEQDASEDKAGLQQQRPAVISGTVDGDGRFIIPASGIDIPAVWAWNDAIPLGGDQVHTYEFEPVGGAVGTIDPFTGDVGIHLRLRIRLSVEGAGDLIGPGKNCYIGSLSQPIAVVLTTADAHSSAGLPTLHGASYDRESGAIRLVGYNVRDVSGASDCGAFGALDRAVGAAFGVPAARGNIQFSGVGRMVPALRPAEAATPEMVRLPRELFPNKLPAERAARTSGGIVFRSSAAAATLSDDSRSAVKDRPSSDAAASAEPVRPLNFAPSKAKVTKSAPVAKPEITTPASPDVESAAAPVPVPAAEPVAQAASPALKDAPASPAPAPVAELENDVAETVPETPSPAIEDPVEAAETATPEPAAAATDAAQPGEPAAPAAPIDRPQPAEPALPDAVLVPTPANTLTNPDDVLGAQPPAAQPSPAQPQATPLPPGPALVPEPPKDDGESGQGLSEHHSGPRFPGNAPPPSDSSHDPPHDPPHDPSHDPSQAKPSPPERSDRE